MQVVAIFWRGLRTVVKTLRLSLPKIGVGWMFALLTINFNRISIHELNVTAVAVTALLGMHYFLSPLQVISGRIADQHPILGYRRTPYLLISSFVGSLVFLALPSVAQAMGEGVALAYVGGLGLFIVFGIAIAVMGDSHHSLIAEVTSPQARGGTMAMVQTLLILSTIIAAGVMNAVMPEYSPAAMQRLYNLTPFIVIGSLLLGIVGMEKRLQGQALADSVAKARAVAPAGNPFEAARHILSTNRQALAFFAFVFVSIFAIFLQDNILEVFGAEVFDMSVKETTQFQPTWGGGVLIGMILMGTATAFVSISKRTIILVGSLGTALGMTLMAFCALATVEAGITPALIFMGLFTGLFNVGALSMMMDMTVEGATGLYMGLWGMAQAFGNGLASVGSGALHTGLIESGLLSANMAYFLIFALEAVGMTLAAYLMWHLNVARFHDLNQSRLTREDALHAIGAGAATA